jgi:hypothetical protein
MDCITERRENLIKELTEQFGQMVRGWAKQATDSDTAVLKEPEQQVRGGLYSLGQKTLQGLVDLVGTGKGDKPVLCPECGEPMEFVRYQAKSVQTMLGPIRPERAYFHCLPCHRGFVPLDRQLGLGANSLSASVEEALCLLSAHMSFEEAVDILARLTLVESDDSTAQRAALQVGTELAEAWPGPGCCCAYAGDSVTQPLSLPNARSHEVPVEQDESISLVQQLL